MNQSWVRFSEKDDHGDGQGDNDHNDHIDYYHAFCDSYDWIQTRRASLVNIRPSTD